MKHSLFIVLIAACVLANAEERFAPRLLNYQGFLTDTINNPITNPSVSMTFSIYDAASAGNLKWTEDQSSVGVSKGIFHVLLGGVNPIPDSVFKAGADRWLELSIAGLALSPRTRIVSVPYAYTSTFADTSLYARNYTPDNDWVYLVSDGADTTLQMGGRWGLTRPGNVLYGNADSTHVNFGVNNTTGTNGQNYKYITVGGGYNNLSNNIGATVSGGVNNVANGEYAVVGGGIGNTANANTTVGGGVSNSCAGWPYATVSGGTGNSARGFSAAVVGGSGNHADNQYTAVGGGAGNNAGGNTATVSGGNSNIANGEYSSVGGGIGNNAGPYATVAGGFYNTASGNFTFVGGGWSNRANGYGATVGGGVYNANAGNYSAILSGYTDTIFTGADYSYLFGINSNLTQDSTFMVDLPHVWFGTEAGGYEFPYGRGTDGQVMKTNGSGLVSWTSITYVDSARVAANAHKLQGKDTVDFNVDYVNEGQVNSIANAMIQDGAVTTTKIADTAVTMPKIAQAGAVVGQVIKWNGTVWQPSADSSMDNDWSYRVTDGADTTLEMSGRWGIARLGNTMYGNADSTHVNLGVGGTTGTNGQNNKYCTVGGGIGNAASWDGATVGGGSFNTASNALATVGGGVGNQATGSTATVGGGQSNVSSNDYTTVSGGAGNTASGYNSTVGGGDNNTTSNSFAVISGGRYNANAGGYSAIVGGYADTIFTSANYSYLFGINSNLTQDSTFMVDLPHVWYGTEASGYEFPYGRGTDGQVIKTDGSGKLSWGSITYIDSARVAANAHKLQGKDTVDFNVDYVNEGQVNSIDSLMLKNSAVTMPKISQAGATAGQVIKWNGTAWQPSADSSLDNDWTYRITDGADTTLQMGGQWGIARYGNTLYGNADSTHVNLGVSSTTGTNGQNFKFCTVGGGIGNVASHVGATVGGGASNTASNAVATVAGGNGNYATGNTATVGGGQSNVSSNDYTTVSGGGGNIANGYNATIVGGIANTASGQSSTIGGGWYNANAGGWAVIVGGFADTITSGGTYSYLFGVNSNLTQDSTFMVDLPHVWFGTEAGGYEFPYGRGTDGQVMKINGSGLLSWGSIVYVDSARIAANAHKLQGKDTVDFNVDYVNEGQVNSIDSFMLQAGSVTMPKIAPAGAVAGQVIKWNGMAWQPSADSSMDNDWTYRITDGADTTLQMGGHWGLARYGNLMYGNADSTHVNFGVYNATGNAVQNSKYCTVSGGYYNIASGYGATIGGGLQSIADSSFATVGGGYGNGALANNTTIGGGVYNTASGSDATVGGGSRNLASGISGSVGGGGSNTASGYGATVSGGGGNIASSDYSAILGGYADTIFTGANYSYLFGINSNLTQDSTFMVDMPHVWLGTEANGYEFPYGRGTDGQVMKINGSGLLSWGSIAYVDSARIAANAHKLQGKDTVDFNNDYVNEGQVNSIDSLMLQNSAVTMPKIAQAGAVVGQVIKWNGTVWQPSADSSIDNDWSYRVTDGADTTLQMGGRWGIARLGSTMFGNADSTHVCLGVQGTTGASGQNYKYATVGGGNGNVASNDYATVGGGNGNTASGYTSTIGGGRSNIASNQMTTISGGNGNFASGHTATVAGGQSNNASNDYTTVGGGVGNAASGYMAIVGGGGTNTASGSLATIGGGQWNKARGQYSVVAGGGGANDVDSNSARGDYSAIGGGRQNQAISIYATIGGGEHNITQSDHATIAGGFENTASGPSAGVGSGHWNTASGIAAFIGGGYVNTASGTYSFVGGGDVNRALEVWAAVSGGNHNTAGGVGSTIGGGELNTASNYYSMVGGGYANNASGYVASISGGLRNNVTDSFAYIGGGDSNYVAGTYSAILGGRADTIFSPADYSYLFGINSNLTQDSTFMVDMTHVWFGTEVNGYEFPRARGTDGQVMKTNGAGLLSWGSITYVDSARIAANAHKLQGKDTVDLNIDYVNEGQVNSITNTMIQSGAVTTTKIADTAVTMPKIAPAGALAGQVIKWNGTAWQPGADSSMDNDWTYRITDGADTTLQMGGRWGIARAGNVLYGNADSTHVNLGVQGLTGASGQNYKYATVSGGCANKATYNSTTAGGGYNNTASNEFATVAGGGYSAASGQSSTIGGGYGNVASGPGSFIGGGNYNTSGGNMTSVTGGFGNEATGPCATVGGGAYNNARGMASVVSGGGYNEVDSNAAQGNFSVVGGGRENFARNHYSTVCGGSANTAANLYAVIAGGEKNLASGISASVLGGQGDTASGYAATVAGGQDNNASGDYAAIGGGEGNTVSGWCTSLNGGYYNTVSGEAATIAGGRQNFAGGDYSAIIGGRADTIASTGDYSYLFGINSNLTQDSTFMVDLPHVWFGTEANGYEFPYGRGTNGQVMVTNGSGLLSWGSITYIDSARIAANAHKLQGKDTTDLNNSYVNEGQVNSITNAMLQDGAVTTTKIADTAVTMPKIAPAGATVGQVIKWNGTAWQPSADSSMDKDWSYRITDVADTTLQMGGRWGLARAGNTLYGNADSTHVNLGVASTTGTNGQDIKYSTVGGGYNNTANNTGATVNGGINNVAGDYSTVGGGSGNSAGGYGTVGGGRSNTCTWSYATVGGGISNYAGGVYATIGGGVGNGAVHYATVGGGNGNQATDYWATVGGGIGNNAAHTATVSGGYYNSAGNSAVIGGGTGNLASGVASAISGGQYNITSGWWTTIGGGFHNTAADSCSFIGSGYYNYTAGMYSAILSGYADTITATGDYSYLFGINSNLTQDSTFMVDMPHIRFGTEANGYEFPKTDGTNGQALVTNGSGQLSWSSTNDNDWTFLVSDGADTTLQMGGRWGIARPGNTLYGNADSTHVNLGVGSTTGSNGQNYKYCTVGGGTLNTATGDLATVGGGASNTASGSYVTISGGYVNTASGNGSTIGGGRANTANGVYSTVTGGVDNYANTYGVVCGGHFNKARGQFSVAVGGGGNEADSNSAIGDYSSIGGGYHNYVTGSAALIDGGSNNIASNSYAVVGGGVNNTASGMRSTIGGGWGNTASNFEATVAGGTNNNAGGNQSTIAGGGYNVTSGTGTSSAIGGGYGNSTTGNAATVGGGQYNTVSSSFGFVGGGAYNKSRGEYAVVSGGGSNDEADSNSAIGNYSAIGGGGHNITSGVYATVGGGFANTTSGYATIGGGNGNTAGEYATVAGGFSNTANNYYATIGGGGNNFANGERATVAGGASNRANGNFTAVAGGQNNTASDSFGFVGAGYLNSTAGKYSAILGGYADTIFATGHYSYLFGINSNLTQDSTFMVDMPHIRFGKESGGYEFPTTDSSSGLALVTDGSGKVSFGTPIKHSTYTPSGGSDPNGSVGDVTWDDSYVYVKTSAGWKRSALSTW